MEMLKNAVNWFEIPVSDFERAKKFYSSIYDYQMPEMMMGPNRLGFLIFDQKEGVGGAIVKGDGYVPAINGARLYLNAGKDLDVVLNRVEKAGGQVTLKKTLISPELGYAASFNDSEGNHVFLHSTY